MRLFTAAVVGMCCICYSADQDHQLLFESGIEGYPRYRIPSLVVTNDAVLVAICEGRKDGGGLTGDVDLVSRRSFDDGVNWTPLSVVADAGSDTLGNASAPGRFRTERFGSPGPSVRESSPKRQSPEERPRNRPRVFGLLQLGSGRIVEPSP